MKYTPTNQPDIKSMFFREVMAYLEDAAKQPLSVIEYGISLWDAGGVYGERRLFAIASPAWAQDAKIDAWMAAANPEFAARGVMFLSGIEGAPKPFTPSIPAPDPEPPAPAKPRVGVQMAPGKWALVGDVALAKDGEFHVQDGVVYQLVKFLSFGNQYRAYWRVA